MRRIQKTINNVTLIAGILFLLCSCLDKATVFHDYQSVKNGVWNRNDTLTFKVDSLVPKQHYAFKLEGRIKKTYPYKNLSIITNNGKVQKTVEIKTERESNPQHQEAIFYNTFLSEEIPFIASDSTDTILLYHAMQRERLEGISEIGICITKR